ncbi:MAG: integral membrane protein terc, tellurite resistance protein TerC [Candidatus Peregrinibacteria bacterium GW2011_GWC2_39_14]|nr:MAG: Integral membrane protein TerC [Candidatus Peregrinibacteria bacterium GW2011_GWA2_38_36]KKR04953.1 MAG: integral membrane protein terc, tellurite resistance protein TerC [Candidatus Peregrinibacteria bacterium GW2011_GWC2_39_14]
MTPQTYLYIFFAIVVVGFLVVDLGYLNRQAHKIGFKSALAQSVFWISIALIFAVLILIFMGHEPAAEFMGAYLTEKMLSVDNLFVIMLLFNFFKLEDKYHHKVLFWGILGAVVFRTIFISTGALIISQFHWVLYIFGAILLYTGVKLFSDKKEEHVDFTHGKTYRLARRFLRFTANPHGGQFMVMEQGKLHFTLLFMIMIMVESTDIIFAIDSIPAAFAISQNFFIVFTSNIFAVMGLRALFFLLENVLHKFHHLQKGLAFILIFIGLKMLVGIFGIHISSIVSLGVVVFALIASMILSIIFPKKI